MHVEPEGGGGVEGGRGGREEGFFLSCINNEEKFGFTCFSAINNQNLCVCKTSFQTLPKKKVLTFVSRSDKYCNCSILSPIKLTIGLLNINPKWYLVFTYLCLSKMTSYFTLIPENMLLKLVLVFLLKFVLQICTGPVYYWGSYRRFGGQIFMFITSSSKAEMLFYTLRRHYLTSSD